MLVVGDIHGNYEKARMFLNYKPKEKHCFVGDYVDSFLATDEIIVKTLNMILNSNSIILSGNHDNQYFKNSGSFTSCSGYRKNSSMLYVNLFQSHKDKIKACHIEDDFIISHGGISKGFGKQFSEDINNIVDYCNENFEDFKNRELPYENHSYSDIFYVSNFRGGYDKFSGIFWATYGHENFDPRFNIICGHTHKQNERTMIIGKQPNQKLHVCVDCPKFICFNTKTRGFEDFMEENKKSNRYELEITY